MRVRDIQERAAFKADYAASEQARVVREQAEAQQKAEAAEKVRLVKRNLVLLESPDFVQDHQYKKNLTADQVAAAMMAAYKAWYVEFSPTPDVNEVVVKQFLQTNPSADLTELATWKDAVTYLQEAIEEVKYQPTALETQTAQIMRTLAPADEPNPNPYQANTKAWKKVEEARARERAKEPQYAENARVAQEHESAAERDRREFREGSEREYWEGFYKSFLATGLTANGKVLPIEAQQDLYKRAKVAMPFIDMQTPEKLRKFAISVYGPGLDLTESEETAMEVEIDDRKQVLSAADFAKRTGLKLLKTADKVPVGVRG